MGAVCLVPKTLVEHVGVCRTTQNLHISDMNPKYKKSVKLQLINDLPYFPTKPLKGPY